MAKALRILGKVIVLVIVLALAGFCLFGFMATFEPAPTPNGFLGFRIVYGVVGLLSLIGAGWMLTVGRK